jgi:(p)ppGpp synthase/HD superfamily hydrolase
VRVGRQLLTETTGYLAQVVASPDTPRWTIDDAETWGVEQHRRINHLRPQSDEPYEVHLGEVVTLIKSVPHTRRMVAGGWLHDVIDDIPGATRETVAAQTDDSVATLVDALSDHEKGQGNRMQRKAAERARIAGADWETQTVRVADIISNVRTIVLRNPEFAKVYVPEKAALLEVLTKADPVLLWAAHQVVRDAQAQLLDIGGAHG